MTEIPIVYIAGDGIGPEITQAMMKVVEAAVRSVTGEKQVVKWIEALAGEGALATTGELLPQETFDLISKYKVAIKGPTATPTGGGHRSVNVNLRQTLDLYANVRPIRWFKGIRTPIHSPERVNFTIFRESTEDVYAGIEFAAGSDVAEGLIDFLKIRDRVPEDSAIGIKPVSEAASRRLMRKAVQFARDKNKQRITIVHKGNIMKFTEGAFSEWCFDEARSQLQDSLLSYSDYREKHNRTVPDGKILVQDRIADAMFQDLLLYPMEHDIIVTLNLNGDYLSDASAALVGGLGMAPGANLGDDVALFEAVHGTAPDIAGKDLANPSAIILSAALLFEHLGMSEVSEKMIRAIEKAVESNAVTGDLFTEEAGKKPLHCSEYGDLLVKFMSQ